ncbi:hypothetical protein BDR07DRAFT_1476354 [Suillus spraguei]|nr:hypothetical protein BDR07DRAFT_1476354 [Suillus spraguei]
MVYSGKVPGEYFNPQHMQNGLFEGYLLEHVMKHIFTGPSSALCADSESVGTHPCNVHLHNMMEVEAENIAYGVIQSHFAIGSCNKWKEDDGNYNYQSAYYQVISTICDTSDPDWAKALHEHWNFKLFKKKLGLHTSSINMTDDGDDNDNNNLAVMRRQYEQRLTEEAGAVQAIPPTPAPTPPKSPSVTIAFEDSTNSTFNQQLPAEMSIQVISPVSLDPKPKESASFKTPELSFKKPAANDLSSEVDKLEDSPHRSQNQREVMAARLF